MVKIKFMKKKERDTKNNKKKNYNLRLKKKKKKEKKLDLSNNEIFPSLVENIKFKHENNTSTNNITDFNKLKLQILNDNTENSLYENISESKQNKNGWLILNKENIDKYKEEKNFQKNLKESSSISRNDIYSCYNKVCINWNKYRDEINNLLGDRSPYFNYETEIERLIVEENQILEEMYGNTYYCSSDDEHNDYENDDFYYFK